MLKTKQRKRITGLRTSWQRLAAAAGALFIVAVGASIFFFPQSAQAAWYEGGSTWAYRLKLTIASANVDANLTDFPVYVDNFWQNTTSDCGDIRITTDDGTTEVPREVVTCDTVAKTGELHFKAPSLSSTTDAASYMYYGNSSVSDYAEAGLGL